jgi:hypothetical protein
MFSVISPLAWFLHKNDETAASYAIGEEVDDCQDIDLSFP